MRLENFKFISESNDSYKIAHPSGKQFTVNKSSLSTKASDAIAAMKGKPQHFDTAGTVSGTPVELPIQPDYAQAAANLVGPDSMPSNQNVPITNIYTPPATTVASPTAEASKTPESPQPSEEGLSLMAQYSDLVKQQLNKANSAEKEMRNLGPEDRNRLWNNTSTGNKVQATIGLLLSGLGFGIAGKPEAALGILNHAIDQDIEAQRQDKSNVMNVWKMHNEVFNNTEAATLAAKNNMMDLAKIQMEESLGNLGNNPLAQQKVELAKQAVQKEQLQNALQIGNIILLNPQLRAKFGVGAPQEPQAPAGAAQAQPKETQAPQKEEAGFTGVSFPSMDEVDANKLMAARTLVGTPTGPTKELMTEADKQYQQLQESNRIKQELKSDFDQMGMALKNGPIAGQLSQTKEWLGNTPQIGPVFGNFPAIGHNQKSFEGAKAAASSRLLTLLTKRIGGEGLKNVKLNLPQYGDDSKEIQKRFEDALRTVDDITPTTALEGLSPSGGILRKRQ